MDQMGTHYNIWIVLLSFALAVTAAYSALNLISQVPCSAGKIRRLWLLSGACVLGGGIWAMHYAGISSMDIEGTIHYEPLAQGISVIIALLASYIGIFLFRKFRAQEDFNHWKLGSALFIGFAVTRMHYISLRTSHLEYDSWISTKLFVTETDVILLTGVSLVTLFILAISGGAVFSGRHVLERLTYNDPLTKLPNRQGLERYFKDEFFGVNSGAVFFVDLDRFKSINDTLGHDIGDMLLQEVADRLKNCIAAKGRVFRLGGDEFLIALPDCSIEDAQKAAQCLLRMVNQAFSIEGNELYVTASVGISIAPVHGTDRSALMKAADSALYTSKDSGKNRFSVFDQEMNRQQLRRMSLEKDLRKALTRSEFIVVYQPKWDSFMNVTVGLEALLRWRHPEHGMISPAEFIPIAEETGLIVPITYWMLHDVCGQNVLWHKAQVANVPVSINMSARMFEDGSLFDVVEEALIRSGLAPHFLELEITESIAMINMEETVAQLLKLRDLGVRVSLDDFGTGFSSLGNLDEIPVNTLKIDQVFIRKSKMHSKKAIISNIIAIASNLNMEVVAEGVETPEQIELLQSLGCRVMQGFYYGRPMPVNELGQWFIENTA